MIGNLISTYTSDYSTGGDNDSREETYGLLYPESGHRFPNAYGRRAAACN